MNTGSLHKHCCKVDRDFCFFDDGCFCDPRSGWCSCGHRNCGHVEAAQDIIELTTERRKMDES